MAKASFLSTGNTLLDLVVGGAPGIMGYPVGRFINIVGDKSAGKSFLCTELIAAVYHQLGAKKFKWCYDDCEAGYSFNTLEMYGVDILPEDSHKSTTVEEAFVNIHNFAKSVKEGQFGIYVLDSLDGLTSDEQDEQAAARVKAINSGKNFDKGTYGMGKPKYLSREFFPQLCSLIQDSNILVVVVSQVRENIDPYSFEKYKRSGGKAMDFYAHTVLWLATLKKIVKKGRPVGVVVKAKTTKSKTPRPFREVTFSIVFDYGVDNVGSNLDYLYDLRTPTGDLVPASKSIAWGGGDVKKVTLNDVKRFLKASEQSFSISGKESMTAYEHWQDSCERKTLETGLEFIASYSELQKAFDKTCGAGEGNVVLSRDKLISYIEENGLEQELANKVITKWEETEADIASSRKKRYATQPRARE